MPALLALVVVTAVWGITFVQVKDALEVYPLFAFLAVRFAIATLTLAPFAAPRLRSAGWKPGALLGALLAVGYALQTAGLERTTDSSAGFITGLYVVFTPVSRSSPAWAWGTPSATRSYSPARRRSRSRSC